MFPGAAVQPDPHTKHAILCAISLDRCESRVPGIALTFPQMKRSHVRAGPRSQGSLTCRGGTNSHRPTTPPYHEKSLSSDWGSPPSTLLSLLCFLGLCVWGALQVGLGVSLDETLLPSCLVILGDLHTAFLILWSALPPPRTLLLFSESVCKSPQARGRDLGEGLFPSFSA